MWKINIHKIHCPVLKGSLFVAFKAASTCWKSPGPSVLSTARSRNGTRVCPRLPGLRRTQTQKTSSGWVQSKNAFECVGGSRRWSITFLGTFQSCSSILCELYFDTILVELSLTFKSMETEWVLVQWNNVIFISFNHHNNIKVTSVSGFYHNMFSQTWGRIFENTRQFIIPTSNVSFILEIRPLHYGPREKRTDQNPWRLPNTQVST